METDTLLDVKNIEIFVCNCGKRFNVRGYPAGYRFACPQCHAFCMVADEDELKEGTVLGDFQVQRRIGRGGMGIVYLGRQLSLDRAVAIKALKSKVAKNQKFIHRFTREAKTAAQIIHNNIVQIYYVGLENHTFFIAMEYVDGKSVRDLINEQRALPESLAVDILLQASLGLQKAHRLNVLHRDIKPDNLILNSLGEVKVADFGLALDLGESRRHVGPAKVEGSPHYLSPEQAMREEITFASDIYSLGATLYHMVTGEPPFTGNSPAAIIAKHVTDYPRSPREINPALSKALCQLVQKMMEKKPEDRLGNIGAVIDELRILSDDPMGRLEVSGAYWFMEERDDSKRLRDMMAVLEVNKVIAQEKDMDQLLLRIIHEITLAMNAERSTLYIYDPDKGQIWAKVAEGLEDQKIIRLPVGKGIAGAVARDLRTEVINNAYEDPRFNREVDDISGFRTRNMVCMPILGREAELLGVIQVLNKRDGDFTSYDESILSALATHVGLALENNMYFCLERPHCKIACEPK